MSPDRNLQDYFNLTPAQLDYLLFCSHEFKFICIRNLRVASSTLVKNLYRLVSGQYPKEIVKIFNRDTEIFPSFVSKQQEHELVQLLSAKEYFTFTFVRNPYTKMLSAYLYFVEDIEKRAGRAFQMQEQFDLPEDYELSFLEFLLRVRETPTSEMNAHWRPQSMALGLDKMMKYDFIGRFETLERDLQSVLQHLNHNPDDHWEIESYRSHGRDANTKLLQYYGHDEQALVAEIYQDDFRYLGYGYELPTI